MVLSSTTPQPNLVLNGMGEMPLPFKVQNFLWAIFRKAQNHDRHTQQPKTCASRLVLTTAHRSRGADYWSAWLWASAHKRQRTRERRRRNQIIMPAADEKIILQYYPWSKIRYSGDTVPRSLLPERQWKGVYLSYVEQEKACWKRYLLSIMSTRGGMRRRRSSIRWVLWV